MALTAEFGKIKGVNLKLAQSIKSGKPSNKTKAKSKDGKGKGNGKGKQDKWTWKKVAPKDNESKTKQFGDRTHHCVAGTHQAWTEHPADEYKLKKKLQAEQQTSNSNNTDNGHQANTASYANTLTAIISRTPPLFVRPFGYDACHHCKHTMGNAFRPQSLPYRYVSRCSSHDSNDGTSQGGSYESTQSSKLGDASNRQ